MRSSAFIPLLAVVLAVALSTLAAPVAPVSAASFDCAKARSKLNRMICADAELSALDSQVWDFYGERIKTLSPAQFAHVRERHLIWRRQRGWFDDTVAQIKGDYRQHFGWLSHPLLPLEGRYVSEDGHAVATEIDLAAQDRLSVTGEVKSRGAYSWVMPYAGEIENRVVLAPDAAAPRPSMALAAGTLGFMPVFLGEPTGAVENCRLALRFEERDLVLTQSGECGAALGGSYRRAQPPAPVWSSRP